jgi:MOSC domain-containing protein YiiM
VGFIEHIHIAPAAAAATRSLAEVRAIAGVGLEGDRYAAGKGYWSPDHKVSRDLTLIEAEVVEEVAREHEPALAAGETRRNVTTRGIRLNDLVGMTFRIGEVLCEGAGLCEPCRYLESITGRRLIAGLVHRGGLRARLLSSGVIRVGDPIEIVGATQPEARRRPVESVDPSGPVSS